MSENSPNVAVVTDTVDHDSAAECALIGHPEASGKRATMRVARAALELNTLDSPLVDGPVDQVP